VAGNANMLPAATTQYGVMVTFVTAAALSVLAAAVTSLLRGRRSTRQRQRQERQF
jgi:membrane protein implicated in regulation of membrane protease activity